MTLINSDERFAVAVLLKEYVGLPEYSLVSKKIKKQHQDYENNYNSTNSRVQQEVDNEIWRYNLLGRRNLDHSKYLNKKYLLEGVK